MGEKGIRGETQGESQDNLRQGKWGIDWEEFQLEKGKNDREKGLERGNLEKIEGKVKRKV